VEPIEITPVALDALLKSDEPPVVLDVREAWEIEICALPGSVSIALGHLGERWADVPADRRVVVVCHHGMRSLQATMFLRSRGRNRTINLAGGLDAWARTIDRSMAVY
jgi:rhodanese-related sulfurtransferase